MPDFRTLLERNRHFAAHADLAKLAMPDRSAMPDTLMLILTCVDPRIEPGGFLELQTGEAGVLRNAGGRVDRAVINDIAYLGLRLQVRMDVHVIHHTQCGTGLLADPAFRADYSRRSGLPDEGLAAKAVVNPTETVHRDVLELLQSPMLSDEVVASVFGHVFHVETGLVETLVAHELPRSRAA